MIHYQQRLLSILIKRIFKTTNKKEGYKKSSPIHRTKWMGLFRIPHRDG